MKWFPATAAAAGSYIGRVRRRAQNIAQSVLAQSQGPRIRLGSVAIARSTGATIWGHPTPRL